MNWRKVKLGDILKRRRNTVKLETDREYKLVTIKLYHKGVILRNISRGEDIKSTMSEIKAGDFILSGIDARNGAFGIVPEELEGAIITNDFWCLEPDEQLIGKEFLLFLTSTEFFDHICKQSSDGTTQRIRLQKDTFFNYEISFPGIEEQGIILSRLKNQKYLKENLTTELSHQLDLIKKLRQQILQDAVQGKLVKQNSEDEPASILLEKIKAEKAQLISDKKIKKEKELSPIKADEIPFDIPKNWVWCKIGDIAIVKIGSTPSRQNLTGWNGDINWVSSGEVANNNIFDTKEKITQSALDNTSLMLYPPGTVLVAMIGQGKTRGQTAILKIPATTNQNVAGLIIDHGLIVSEFLWFFFLSRYDVTRGFATGGNQPALNGIKISNTIFPLPPLSEQQRIVTKVEELLKYCDKLEQNIKNNQKYTEMLMQVALKEALTPSDVIDSQKINKSMIIT